MIQPLNRRDFTKLSMAALGGTLAGTALTGCKSDGGPSKGGGAKNGGSSATTETSLLMVEPHVCKGLNTCKGKGACKTASNECKKKNACAGQGKCASAVAHTCHKDNTCKGQGGCGETAGINDCKTKGECDVPLKKPETWTKVRASFEAAMKKAEKKFGPAPAKKAAKKEVDGAGP